MFVDSNNISKKNMLLYLMAAFSLPIGGGYQGLVAALWPHCGGGARHTARHMARHTASHIECLYSRTVTLHMSEIYRFVQLSTALLTKYQSFATCILSV
jgi:hypothetical protein